MDDLINRQAAIDALWKALYEYEDKTEKQFIDSEELDVADWIQHRNFVQNMSDIDRQTILSLPSAQPEAQWIPCSEPPENEYNVFIAHGAKDFMTCCIGHYDSGSGLWYEDRNWFARPIFDGAFWCEIPLMPEAEE